MNPSTNQYDLLDPTGVMNGTRGVKTYYPYAALANTSLNTKEIHDDTATLIEKADTIIGQLNTIATLLTNANSKLDTIIDNQSEGV